jgi:hypothetical protein
VTEAAGVVIFFWEEKWEVGVSAVHGLHDPPMICQYFNFFVLNFLSLSPSVGPDMLTNPVPNALPYSCPFFKQWRLH